MVQSNQGVWFHSAGLRRQGCFRAHLSGGKSRFSSLAEGAKVSYEEKDNRGKTSAENLRIG
jgi:cold shock CspA family protein